MSARGPKIKPSILKLINLQAVRYRDKPREALAADLQDTIGKMGEISPDTETLKRKISWARNHDSPLDAPWHSGIMRKNDYDISPQALPYIFAVQNWAENNELETITIRQAIWISILFASYGWPIGEDDTASLYRMSYYYAEKELISELSGIPEFDTTELDNALRHGELDKMILSDIQDILEKGKNSPILRARDKKREALPESERIRLDSNRDKKALAGLITELSKPDTLKKIEKANKFKRDNPNATEEDIFNYLQKDGE
jgi:hypothetical protein